MVSSSASKKPIKPAKPQALMGKKPAKFALEGNKWAIVRVSHPSLPIDRLPIITINDHRSITRTRRR